MNVKHEFRTWTPSTFDVRIGVIFFVTIGGLSGYNCMG